MVEDADISSSPFALPACLPLCEYISIHACSSRRRRRDDNSSARQLYSSHFGEAKELIRSENFRASSSPPPPPHPPTRTPLENPQSVGCSGGTGG